LLLVRHGSDPVLLVIPELGPWDVNLGTLPPDVLYLHYLELVGLLLLEKGLKLKHPVVLRAVPDIVGLDLRLHSVVFLGHHLLELELQFFHFFSDGWLLYTYQCAEPVDLEEDLLLFLFESRDMAGQSILFFLKIVVIFNFFHVKHVFLFFKLRPLVLCDQELEVHLLVVVV